MSDTWFKMMEQRDHNGELTNLALALNAIKDAGCDCEEDEPEICLACLCERALKSQWEDWNKLQNRIIQEYELHEDTPGYWQGRHDALSDVLRWMCGEK